jgi:hypothetical protein
VKDSRERKEWQLKVEGRDRRSVGNDLVYSPTSGHEVRQLGLSSEDDPTPQRLHVRGESYEHQGVAEALLVVKQERPVRKGLAVPSRLGKMPLWTDQSWDPRASFVPLPALSHISEQPAQVASLVFNIGGGRIGSQKSLNLELVFRPHTQTVKYLAEVLVG